MNKYSKVTKLILLLIIILFFGTVYYLKFSPRTSDLTDNSNAVIKDNNQASTTLSNNDPACDGEKNPYATIGYGIKHNYSGSIIAGKKISMTLSCDHKTITLSGSVNQTLQVKNKEYNEAGSDVGMTEDGPDGLIELADLSSGTEVIDTDSDYNFDGYNDITSISSNGQGRSAIDSFIIFLYNPKTNQFVFNKQLSNLENISVTENKTLMQQYCYFDSKGYSGKCNITYYKWKDEKLIKTGGEVQSVE